jgi:hypothetical protein
MIVPDIANKGNGGGSIGARSHRTAPPVPARLDRRKYKNSIDALNYSINVLYEPLPGIGFPRKHNHRSREIQPLGNHLSPDEGHRVEGRDQPPIVL